MYDYVWQESIELLKYKSKTDKMEDMNMSEKLRVAVIGAGQIANSAHIPAWKSTEGVEIVAVVDNRENVAEITAKRYNIPNVYKDYKVMLEEIKPDIVSVCTPNNFHKPCAIAALEAGAHVLCEKPLSVSEKDAREMYDVAHRCGKYLMASQSMRFDTRTKAAKALYDTGIVGDPYYVQANLVRRRGIPKWGFFHMKEYNTAGPGFDLGVHVLDLLLWFMGSPAPISVSGRNYEKIGNTDEKLVESIADSGAPVDLFTPRLYDWHEFNVEDLTTAYIQLEGGITLMLKTSWALNAPEEDNRCYISGTEGGLVVIPETTVLTNMGGYQVEIQPKIPVQTHQTFEGHYGLTSHFVRVIRGEEEMIVTENQVLNVLRILDAIYESSETGKEIRF